MAHGLSFARELQQESVRKDEDDAFLQERNDGVKALAKVRILKQSTTIPVWSLTYLMLSKTLQR